MTTDTMDDNDLKALMKRFGIDDEAVMPDFRKFLSAAGISGMQLQSALSAQPKPTSHTINFNAPADTRTPEEIAKDREEFAAYHKAGAEADERNTYIGPKYVEGRTVCEVAKLIRDEIKGTIKAGTIPDLSYKVSFNTVRKEVDVAIPGSRDMNDQSLRSLYEDVYKVVKE